MESRTLINDSELAYLANLLVAKYKENLFLENVPASGLLTSTANSEIRIEGQHICIYFNLQDYWKYVEYGRKPGGKFPPILKIEEWIRIKPVIPRAGLNGKVPTTKQLAYLISRKIAVKGIEPKNVLQYTLNENSAIISAFALKVSELLSVEVTNIISEI